METLPAVVPQQVALPVRGREFTLTAMAGEAALDWAEMQILCAREKVAAMQLSCDGKEESVRAVLEQLHCADVVLVVKALGCEAEFAVSLTTGEKQQILAHQDELNRVAVILPFLAIHNQAAQVWTRDVKREGSHGE